MIIREFQGANRFLSNFWPCLVRYNDLTYPSSEAAYQAAKCAEEKDKKAFAKMKPGDAKRAGRKVATRPDWEQVKLAVMEEIVRIKFSTNPKLKELLLATGDAELREGNNRGDKFWGMVGNTGHNHLGKILMKVRKELTTTLSHDKV